MRVELREVALTLRRPVMTGRGPIARREGLLVRIHDHDVSGWGEALPLPGWPGADLAATRRALQAWAADPHPEALPTERFARGAVELALLDVEARRRTLTQAEVLADGGPVASSVALNALVQGPEDAAAAVARGYRTVKLKVGASPPEEDVATVAAVRAAIGEAAKLRLDANGAWTAEHAVTVLAQLEPHGVDYVEEPVAGLEALAEVAERSPVPVAADESLKDADTEVPEVIAVLVIKPMALGGPRTAHGAACRWIERGHRVVVTNFFDSAVGQHAALSTAAALPGPPEVHGAITPDLFTHDLAPLPPIASGHCPLPPHSPTPTISAPGELGDRWPTIGVGRQITSEDVAKVDPW
ncbi:o-succinylbenzoate synthase [Candidatus Poriferisocius sp.]|uniref:o-succinylbenzoate synthase n=1 Tax=Candidatus Poriferisocius sp. TaxID=3101276 RepID=UPI003B5A690F